MAAKDNGKGGLDLIAPAGNAFAIVINTEFDVTARAIYVGVGGNINILTVGDQTVLFKGATAGSIIPVACKKVLTTSTTATDLVGLY